MRGRKNFRTDPEKLRVAGTLPPNNSGLAVAYRVLFARSCVLFSCCWPSQLRRMRIRCTLKQAIAYAREHQPSLVAARARVEVARAQAQLPRAAQAVRIGGAAELLGGTNNNTTASYATLGFLDVARIGGTPANAAGVVDARGVDDRRRLGPQGALRLRPARPLGDALDLLARPRTRRAEAAALDLDLFVEESFYAVLGAQRRARRVRGRGHALDDAPRLRDARASPRSCGRRSS